MSMERRSVWAGVDTSHGQLVNSVSKVGCLGLHEVPGGTLQAMAWGRSGRSGPVAALGNLELATIFTSGCGEAGTLHVGDEEPGS